MNINVQCLDLLVAKQEINYSQLARASGVSRQSISTILKRGTCHPNTAAKLARGLGVGMIEILEDTK